MSNENCDLFIYTGIFGALKHAWKSFRIPRMSPKVNSYTSVVVGIKTKFRKTVGTLNIDLYILRFSGKTEIIYTSPRGILSLRGQW